MKNEKIEEGSNDAKNNTMSVGAFGRYYATPASKFSFFGQLGFNYNSYDNEFGVDSNGDLVIGESKGNGFDIMLSPGVNYFISNNFALEASFGALGYETSKPDVTGADATNTFGLNLDMSTIKLGLVYKF